MLQMTVLVTGGAGYIGSHMALELLNRDEKVVIIDDLSTGSLAAIPCQAVFVQGDIGDESLVKEIISKHDIDAIVHFAGSIVVPESVVDPLKYYHNNTANSRNLVAAAVATDVRHFIFSSTAAVYGIPGSDPVTEEAPKEPISPYGNSKRMTELMLSDTARAHDFSYVALRYFNVAGADPLGRTGQSTPLATHLIKVACEAAVGKREFIEIYGTDYNTADGTCVRDYVHVSDLATAHWSALEYLRSGGESNLFNCGYGRGYSVLEVIETVQRIAGSDFEVRTAARRPGDPATLVSNPNRIHKALDWKPLYQDIDSIVTHALAWEKKLVSEQWP